MTIINSYISADLPHQLVRYRPGANAALEIVLLDDAYNVALHREIKEEVDIDELEKRMEERVKKLRKDGVVTFGTSLIDKTLGPEEAPKPK